MVNLTRPVSVQLSPCLNIAEDLLTGRGYGRKNIQDKDVPFIERLPLSLKNWVSNQSMKNKDKACMNEMMTVIACLSKYDQNMAMCDNEIVSFKKCFSNFKSSQEKAKTFRESGQLPIGPYAKMTGPQLTSYMNKFMQSNRTGQFHPNSVFKKGAR